MSAGIALLSQKHKVQEPGHRTPDSESGRLAECEIARLGGRGSSAGRALFLCQSWRQDLQITTTYS